MRDKVLHLIEQMKAHLELTKAEQEKFKTTCVYTNPGDMNYLGQMQGDIAGTQRALVRLEEIVNESE